MENIYFLKNYRKTKIFKTDKGWTFNGSKMFFKSEVEASIRSRLQNHCRGI